MELKEEAKKLFDKFIHTVGSECEHSCYCEDKECQYQGRVICRVDQQKAKQCALISCDLMIENEPGIRQVKFIDDVEIEYTEYWEKVKEEIQKL